MSPAVLIAFALVIASGAASVAGERVSNSVDGTFGSKRPASSASLHVLVGADGALVYYSGGFGPGCLDEAKGWCRSCELGPVLALRDSSGGFLVVSGEGKARLVVKDNGWQLRFIEGTADWCGEGWGGDDFKKNGRRPQSCSVAADGAALREAGAKSGAPPRRVAARGEKVLALDALPTDAQQLLVKVQDTVGVMRREDMTCTHP